MNRPEKPTPAKPTVLDIAERAGVSLATVDRVLNARAGASKTSIEKVRRAVVDLGYVRDTAAANLARKRIYNLHFILPDLRNEFIDALEAEIAEQSRHLTLERTRLTAIRTAPFDSLAIVRRLDALTPDQTDGVALFGPETPSLRDAIRRARERGVAVVAFVSDLPSSERAHFVGVDNRDAGRTAGLLMGRFLGAARGRVLVITGSRLARDHLERRIGFDEVLANRFPHLSAMPSVEISDDPGHVARHLKTVFAAHGDIVGVYASVAGSLGLARFLTETTAAPTVIAHELTPVSRAALRDGLFDAVISQDTGHLVRSAVRLMRATVDKAPFDATQERIRIDVYLETNIPPDKRRIFREDDG